MIQIPFRIKKCRGFIGSEHFRSSSYHHDECEKLLTRIDLLTGSIPSRITRIVDFPDRARRAVGPATFTPVDREKFGKNSGTKSGSPDQSMIRINPIRIALVAPLTPPRSPQMIAVGPPRCLRKKNPFQTALVTLPLPPDDCEKLTRIVDFADRARRAET